MRKFGSSAKVWGVVPMAGSVNAFSIDSVGAIDTGYCCVTLVDSGACCDIWLASGWNTEVL